MKRLLGVGMLCLLLGLSVLVGRLGSQPRPNEGPRTRIALINLGVVFKNSARVNDYNEANKALLQPYQEKAKDLQQQIEAHTKALAQKDLPDDIRSQHETNLKTRQRAMEDLTNEIKVVFTRKNDQLVGTVYKEILDAAERFAKAREFDLVMHYSDVASDAPDFFSAAHVNRRIQSGSPVPLYVAPGNDITKDVTASLNEKYRLEKEAGKPVSR